MILKNKKGFTLVELIVTVTIVSILSTIWFVSLGWYLSYSRDTERKAELSQLSAALKIFKKDKWSYPIPSEYFSIINSWSIVAWQWKMWKTVWLSTIEEIPIDPKINIPYLYSISSNKQEYQLAGSLENYDWDNEIALVLGSYKSVAKKILPGLILAYDWTTWDSLEIHDWIWNGSNNRKLFIYNSQSKNMPYSFTTLKPTTTSPDFDVLLSEAEAKNFFYQNSSFKTCDEIYEAGKSIWDWDYELRTDTWSLTSSGCTF